MLHIYTHTQFSACPQCSAVLLLQARLFFFFSSPLQFDFLHFVLRHSSIFVPHSVQGSLASLLSNCFHGYKVAPFLTPPPPTLHPPPQQVADVPLFHCVHFLQQQANEAQGLTASSAEGRPLSDGGPPAAFL